MVVVQNKNQAVIFYLYGTWLMLKTLKKKKKKCGSVSVLSASDEKILSENLQSF